MSTSEQSRGPRRQIAEPIEPTDTLMEVIRKTPLGDWRPLFEEEKDTLENISEILEKNERKYGPLCPSRELIFEAFRRTPLRKVKVALIVQDPYHKPGVATGLALSCRRGAPIQPTLKTVYKELEDEFEDFVAPDHGDLSEWAKRGVLLLNSRLTVHEGMPNKYNQIWTSFTQQVVEYIKHKQPNTIFMVWGSAAQKDLKDALDGANVLTAAHPSPVNTRGGFLGCEHFYKANIFLKSVGRSPIDWTIS
jgi:uracil-DNA glycosylase